MFQNTAKLLPIKMHILKEKNHCNFNCAWSEIISLKSNRIELGFNLYGQKGASRVRMVALSYILNGVIPIE